jgi:hypothetical protein
MKLLSRAVRILALSFLAFAALAAWAETPVLLQAQKPDKTRGNVQMDASSHLFFTQGNGTAPTYVACSAAEANTTTAEAIVIEAGAAKTTRIRSLWVYPGSQASAANRAFTILRRTTASTSGSTIVPAPVDSTDAAFSGIVRTKPTAGNAGVTLFTAQVWVPAAVAQGYVVLWPPPQVSPGVIRDLTVPAGVANGIGFSDAGASGGQFLTICAAFTEE